MMKGCFGRFGEGECIECNVMELCSSYFVVEQSGRCPLFGIGYDNANGICRLCVEYFIGKECRKELSKRKR